MTYPAARKRIIEVVEKATPTSKAKALGDAFRFDAAGGPSVVVSAPRRFHFRMVAGGLRGPFRARANTVRLNCELIVEYVAMNDLGALDAAVVADFVVIATALSSADLQFDATGLRLIGGENAVDLFTFTVDETPTSTRLRIRFPIEVRND